MVLKYQNNPYPLSNHAPRLPSRRRPGHILVLLWLLSVSSVPALGSAQVTSVVRGVVTDPGGGALPGTTVALRHGASGLERHTVAGADGRFELPNLSVGRYDVLFTLAGFRPERRRVDLTSALPVDLPVTLNLAAVTDTVEVSPEVPVVDATSAGTRHM